MNWKTILAGALGGFIAALAVDLNAWSKSEEPFDWGLAFRRWLAGAVAGISAGSGMALTGE